MKERIVFQTNVPVTAALAYPDGIKVEGLYGDQVIYTLADERVIYVPPIVRSKLTELGIGKNEPFFDLKGGTSGRQPALHRMERKPRQRQQCRCARS